MLVRTSVSSIAPVTSSSRPTVPTMPALLTSSVSGPERVGLAERVDQRAFVRDVGLHGERAAALRLDVAHDGARIVDARQVRDRDVVAARRGEARGGGADAPAAAGDEADAARGCRRVRH